MEELNNHTDHQLLTSTAAPKIEYETAMKLLFTAKGGPFKLRYCVYGLWGQFQVHSQTFFQNAAL